MCAGLSLPFSNNPLKSSTCGSLLCVQMVLVFPTTLLSPTSQVHWTHCPIFLFQFLPNSSFSLPIYFILFYVTAEILPEEPVCLCLAMVSPAQQAAPEIWWLCNKYLYWLAKWMDLFKFKWKLSSLHTLNSLSPKILFGWICFYQEERKSSFLSTSDFWF